MIFFIVFFIFFHVFGNAGISFLLRVSHTAFYLIHHSKEYKNDIKQINSKMAELLKKDGYLCVVLPDYETADKRKEVIEDVVKNYIELGLTKEFEINRYIPSHKRTLSIQWATLVNERIYIFRKGE